MWVIDKFEESYFYRTSLISSLSSSTYHAHRIRCASCLTLIQIASSLILASSLDITAVRTSMINLSASLFKWPGHSTSCRDGKLRTAPPAQVPLFSEIAFARQLADKVCLSSRAFALGETQRELKVELFLMQPASAPLKFDACHSSVISLFWQSTASQQFLAYKSSHFSP